MTSHQLLRRSENHFASNLRSALVRHLYSHASLEASYRIAKPELAATVHNGVEELTIRLQELEDFELLSKEKAMAASYLPESLPIVLSKPNTNAVGLLFNAELRTQRLLEHSLRLSKRNGDLISAKLLHRLIKQSQKRQERLTKPSEVYSTFRSGKKRTSLMSKLLSRAESNFKRAERDRTELALVPK